jgi:predicted type IV restriction endonuclease|tara:strand:- start:868 stop:1740 length:873 start_codon:yes stop_codon:yes gene_type:complete
MPINIPKRVHQRIKAGIKKFQPILKTAKDADVNESNTVTIVHDLLTDIFGYKRYVEVTKEYKVKADKCDLAIKQDGVLQKLIEVKPIGTTLNKRHVKQATHYGADEKCSFVMLTNGQIWQVYELHFDNGLDADLVCELDLMNIDLKDEAEIAKIWMLTKEGRGKSELRDFAAKAKARNKYNLAAILLDDACLKVVRRELKRISPEVSFDLDDIKQALVDEVIIKETQQDEEAKEARAKVKRSKKLKIRRNTKRVTKNVEKIDVQPNAPVAPPVQVVETTTVTETPQGTGV